MDKERYAQVETAKELEQTQSNSQIVQLTNKQTNCN